MKMRSTYAKQLEALDETLCQLAKRIGEDICATGKALSSADQEEVADVISAHRKCESQLKSVEDSCMQIMLLQQPMASDLRLVTAAFRAISDLSRIHEMSYEIALLIRESELTLARDVASELDEMARRAAKMVEDAATAFTSKDTALAGGVFPQDSAVDRLFDKVREHVVEQLKAGTEQAVIAPELLSIAKYFERMGDHAQSIADWALFRATGVYRGRTMADGQ